MDVERQVDYWRAGGEEDIAAAEALMEKGHLRHALFLAHLAIEKMLKAHVTRKTAAVPPRIHNLVRLAELAGLALDSERATVLHDFDGYQLTGRYPDFMKAPLDSGTAQADLMLAKKVVEWLTKKL